MASNLLGLEQFIKQTAGAVDAKQRGLVPRSGNWEHPERWVKPEEVQPKFEKPKEPEPTDGYLHQILIGNTKGLKKVSLDEKRIVNDEADWKAQAQKMLQLYEAELNKEMVKPEDKQDPKLIIGLKRFINKRLEYIKFADDRMKVAYERINRIDAELDKRKEKDLEEALQMPDSSSLEQKMLSAASVKTSQSLGGGTANQTILLVLDTGKRGIFKPSMGEDRSMRNDIDGPLYKNEVAAYEVAKLLDLADYVPPTSVKIVDEEVGSIQEWVEDAEAVSQYSTVLDSVFELEAIQDCALFNALIGNEDRHGLNMLAKDGAPMLIDHGYAFPNQARPNYSRSVFVRFLQDKNEDNLSAHHADMLDDFLANKNEFAEHLSNFLGKREIASMFVRAEMMLNSESYSMNFNWDR